MTLLFGFCCFMLGLGLGADLMHFAYNRSKSAASRGKGEVRG